MFTKSHRFYFAVQKPPFRGVKTPFYLAKTVVLRAENGTFAERL